MTGVGLEARQRISSRAQRALFFLAFSFFLLAAPLLAEEAAPSVENSPIGWTFRWIIFAIVFIGLVWAFAKTGALVQVHRLVPHVPGIIPFDRRCVRRGRTMTVAAKLIQLHG